MVELHRAIAAAELPPGRGTSVALAGRALAIFNVGGTFHAIENNCRHRGGPLGQGELEGNVVTSPLHGWTYDVTSGACLSAPHAKVACFPCRVEGADVIVELPG
jgi:nitrite reductase/ring-hydroxylating ferredoxin subunit